MERFETFVNGEKYEFQLTKNYNCWIAELVVRGWYGGASAEANNPDDAILRLVKKIESNGK